MEDRRTMSLALQQGETRQLLLEAGCTVLVVAGRIRLRSPGIWLAEQLVRGEQWLAAEQAWSAETGGWVDLTASESARLVVLPADGIAFWHLVGRCLDSLFGTRAIVDCRGNGAAAEGGCQKALPQR